MQKLMILGASYSQLPLYEAARQLGVSTVAASTPGDWPGFAVADQSVSEYKICDHVRKSSQQKTLQRLCKTGQYYGV